MKNFIKNTKTIVFVALMCCTVFFSTTVLAQSKKVEIRAGTPIEVATTTEISSKTHPLGTVVDLKTLNPILVDGIVVIPAGSTVKGRVSQCQKSRLFGGAGSIEIEAKSITAIDGTMVPISNVTFSNTGKSNLGWAIIGTVCCLFGFLIHGTNGVIPSGTQMSGNVMANTSIMVSNVSD